METFEENEYSRIQYRYRKQNCTLSSREITETASFSLAVYLRVMMYRREMDEQAKQLASIKVVADSLSEKSRSGQSPDSKSGVSSSKHRPKPKSKSPGTSFLPINVWKPVSRALIVCMTECAGCIRLQGEVNDLNGQG